MPDYDQPLMGLCDVCHEVNAMSLWKNNRCPNCGVPGSDSNRTEEQRERARAAFLKRWEEAKNA